jgi:hypothetical protein
MIDLRDIATFEIVLVSDGFALYYPRPSEAACMDAQLLMAVISFRLLGIVELARPRRVPSPTTLVVALLFSSWPSHPRSSTTNFSMPTALIKLANAPQALPHGDHAVAL